MDNAAAIIAGLTTLAAGIAAIIKNTRDISILKKYACFRLPCPRRLSQDELQSKSSDLEN